ncbi:general substrate transporter [Schizophyllum amplum]|uniref:General substrate transporter n=1 Tax=Schizophyllum amplum TaxID=97359 RepID=A0A550CL93_9AGAR|nr:general substrate transporter [Auriculariopsis ampla]
MAGGPAGSGGGVGGTVPARNKFAGVVIASFAAFGGILFGYDTGTISGIKEMNVWLRTFGDYDENADPQYYLKSSTESLVVSILSAGTFFGALLGAPVADYVGRKWGTVMSCLVFAFGVALQTGSTSLPLYIVGRVFAGLGVGLVSCLVPMYQSECAPKWIRGAVVSGYQWTITIGLLLAAIVNNATKDRTDHSSWRIPTAIQFVWAFVLAAGMAILPESPRWLVKKGKDEAASAAMGRLLGYPKGAPEIQIEIDDIRTALEEERALGESSYLDCFKTGHKKILLRTMTGISIQMWQQLTGINFIFYYGTTFFKNSGISNPFIITVITNVVNVVMTIPGIYLIEKAGRRSLLLWGAVIMTVCEYLVAIIGVTISVEDSSGQKALIALVCIYIAAFAATWGPIAWVITGEIFPLQIRAKAMSLSVASNWLWNWAIGYATPYLVNKEPGSAGLEAKVFFIWGTCCLCCIVFTLIFVPETKGLSLEQVDLLYENTVPYRAAAYRRHLLEDDVHAANEIRAHDKNTAKMEHHEDVEKAST